MQSGGHIGKIIVRPAYAARSPRALPTRLVPARPRGASGGGRRVAVSVSRQPPGSPNAGRRPLSSPPGAGFIEPHLLARADAIRATGTTLLVETLDVTDADAAVEPPWSAA